MDGQLVHESQQRMDGGTNHAIPIGSETGIVRITTNGFTFGYDLVVGGRSLTTGEIIAQDAPTMPTWVSRVSNAGTMKAGRPVITQENLNKELRNTGMILLVLGLLHLIVPDLWLWVWGLIMAGVGLASRLIQRPVMLLVLGGLLVAAGALNLVAEGANVWMFLGFFQIMIGLAQYPRYLRHADALGRQQEEER